LKPGLWNELSLNSSGYWETTNKMVIPADIEVSVKGRENCGDADKKKCKLVYPKFNGPMDFNPQSKNVLIHSIDIKLGSKLL
jgi:hypothetical protein